MHQHAHMPKDAGGSQTLIHTPAVGLAAHAHEPQSPINVCAIANRVNKASTWAILAGPDARGNINIATNTENHTYQITYVWYKFGSAVLQLLDSKLFLWAALYM